MQSKKSAPRISIAYTFKRLLCTYIIAALSDNLLVATYALLLFKLVRHRNLRDPRDLEFPRALSSAGPSLPLGTLQPRALWDIINHVDPSVSVSNLESRNLIGLLQVPYFS